MVEEIRAYKAEDGSIHSIRLDAVKHDAVEKLKKMQIFNHASALAIVDAADEVAPILQQVMWAAEEARISQPDTSNA